MNWASASTHPLRATRAALAALGLRRLRTGPPRGLLLALRVLVAALVLVLVLVAEERVLGALDEALCLAGCAALAHPLDHLGETLAAARLHQVEPVDRLREAQVGVDARDDDSRVDREDLDPDQ